MPVDTRRNKRKLRREFRKKGYRAVYLEVSGYPPGKRELPCEQRLRLRKRGDATPRELKPYILMKARCGASSTLSILPCDIVQDALMGSPGSLG